MNKYRRCILPAACTILSAAAALAVRLNYDSTVINMGIRAYKTQKTVSLAILIACAMWNAVMAWLTFRKKPEQGSKIPDIREESSMSEGDRKQLYQELAEFLNKKWSGMKEAGTLLAQLDSMDEYQDELGRLLEQTKYLKQKPAEIVQQVEDCMYVNIRKLLNYMRIIQTKSPDLMRSKIAECIEKNADLLKKTDDFVVAVVGYVNGDLGPGKDADTKDYVDTYMYVVLQAIKLPETYLK